MRTFTHNGQTYRRHPDGRIELQDPRMSSGWVEVTGTALTPALRAASEPTGRDAAAPPQMEDPTSQASGILPPATASSGETDYDRAVRLADDSYKDAKKAAAAARAAAAGGDPVLSRTADEAVSRLAQTEVTLSTALRARGAAIEAAKAKATTPEERARLDAQAKYDQARIEQITADLAEAKETAPDRRATSSANARTAAARADIAEAERDIAVATSDQEREAANIKLEQARAALVTAQETSRNAGRVSDAGAERAEGEAGIVTARAGQAPAQEAAATATAQADAEIRRITARFAGAKNQAEIDSINSELQTAIKNRELIAARTRTEGAAADVATQTVGTNVEKAKAELEQVRIQNQQLGVELQAAQRRLAQMPTDAQAQQAVTAAMRALELGNDQLQATISRATTLLPHEVTQIQTNIDAARETIKRSQEATRQAQQGSLYGLEERITTISDLLRRGLLKGGQAEADQMINDYVSSSLQGASIFDVKSKEAELGSRKTDQSLTQRGQDIQFEGQKLGAYSSMANQASSTFQDMNNRVNVGSDAAGKAFIASLGMIKENLGGFQAPAPVDIPDAPKFLQNYQGGMAGARGMFGQPPGGMPPPPTPAPAPQPAPVVQPPAPTGQSPVQIIVNTGGGSRPEAPMTVPPPAVTQAQPFQARALAKVDNRMGGMPRQSAATGIPMLDAKMAPTSMEEAMQNIQAAYGSGGAATALGRRR